MSEVTFIIPGKPFGKQRPRATRGGRMYTPAATVSFERTVSQIALEHMPEPLVGPVALEIVATFTPAASWSAKKRAAFLNQPHTQKPDLDNCTKAILDGLNRIAFADDAQVADIRCRKVWGDVEQTVVRLCAMVGSALNFGDLPATDEASRRSVGSATPALEHNHLDER